MLPFVFKLSPASLAANDAVEHATKNCPFTVSDSVHGMLSPVELEAMSARMEANADEWLARKIKPPVVKAPKAAKAVRRPPKVVANPFAGYLMSLDDFGRSYPLFAMDIIEGIARLDWHDRPIGVGGISKPLSVKRIINILEWLPEITNDAVEDFLGLQKRHARRYVKAAELAIPRMMRCRPESLRCEMDGVDPDPGPCVWVDLDDVSKPSSAELAQLHHDLRTLTQFKTAEEYERDDVAKFSSAPSHDVIVLPVRKQHPKREEVMNLLGQEVPKLQIERITGVQRKTITKWQQEELSLAA